MGPALRALALAALAGGAPARGQPAEPASSWEVVATAGGLRADRDFAAVEEAVWGPVFGARLAWRPGLLMALGIEVWRATLDVEGGLAVLGGGARMAATPWAGRGWPVDPALVFGLEMVDAEDDEERGPAFVSGAGVRRDAGRWTLHAEVLHRFLTIEEEPVDGVGTGRDSSLWEVRLSVGPVLGGR